MEKLQVRLDRSYAEKDKIEAKLEFSQSELGKIKAELDKSQGDQNIKYNDYNDSRQKLYKFEQEIERLRQENDRYVESSELVWKTRGKFSLQSIRYHQNITWMFTKEIAFSVKL